MVNLTPLGVSNQQLSPFDLYSNSEILCDRYFCHYFCHYFCDGFCDDFYTLSACYGPFSAFFRNNYPDMTCACVCMPAYVRIVHLNVRKKKGKFWNFVTLATFPYYRIAYNNLVAIHFSNCSWQVWIKIILQRDKWLSLSSCDIILTHQHCDASVIICVILWRVKVVIALFQEKWSFLVRPRLKYFDQPCQ